MFFTFLLTLIGGSLGGILALGTAWASVKRYAQRVMARHLADVIPKDASTAIILARNHAGKEKAEWIRAVLVNAHCLNQEQTRILDLAGGTHLDLVEELLPKCKDLHVYDGKVALEYLARERPGLLTQGKLTLRQGETISSDLSTFAHDETFDVVLAVDILHAIHPELRHDVVSHWTRLVKPTGGAVLIIFETEPFSTVSQAGIVQGIFFRANHVAIKGLLESLGFTEISVSEYPPQNRIAVLGKKGKTPLQDGNVDKSWE